MIYFCSQQNRRALVLQHPTLNGIDYLEANGSTLSLTFLKPAGIGSITTGQILITGGAMVSPVSVQTSASAPNTLTIDLDGCGDFSTYSLRLVATPATTDPPDGFDPALAAIDFSFKAGCAAPGDCAPAQCCPVPARPEPDINYLAKDYDAFVQVMLDRIAVLVPDWTERHAGDPGLTLVEALAYTASRMSYQQDAVGTEAYLGTARSRISLRRHAKLVDYQVSEGSNARAWVYVKPAPGAPDPLAVPISRVFPRVPGLPASVGPNSRYASQLADSPLGFTTLEPATLHKEQDEIPFYTWSDANCCLPPGSTEATLNGRFLTLQPGTLVLFEEVVGPETGRSEDADPAKRWVVRLTAVQNSDYKNRALVDPLTQLPITRIQWDAADALPFPLCISAKAPAAGQKPLTNVSVARGNLVPADHGLLGDWEDLGTVPAPPQAPVAASGCHCGESAAIVAPKPRYFPQLSRSPLTWARPYDPAAPATALLDAATTPVAQLWVLDSRNEPWSIEPDLFLSSETTQAFVAETERDQTVYLRFGDGQYGAAPISGESFRAQYRVGNGAGGNIGHDTLAHIVTNAAISEVRNPLPAAGGTDPETPEHIRQRAPYAFRTQLRAITEDDYGAQAALDTRIRAARGQLRWTGSWYTAFVSIDSTLTGAPAASLLTSTLDRLDLVRTAGIDLAVEGAVVVGLRIEMDICVAAGHFQADVQAALLRVFTSGDTCTGKKGVLDPSNFTFGQTIYISPLIAAAQAVDGVVSAVVTKFQRMDDPLSDATVIGSLAMGRTEIARCDNDPNRLDHGVFVLHMDGGK